jgi:RNA polymerase sigma-70 factor (ECF subfamily)
MCADEATAELIDRAKRDRRVFGQLYDLYLRRIYAFCLVHSRSGQDAEDLTALTFERALAGIGRYENRGTPFSQWLFRIAANLAIDRARRAQGVVLLGDDALNPLGSPDSLTNPAILVERWERANRLLDGVSALPQEQQEAVRLRFYAECSFAEVGEAMARSEAAAKQLVYRALRQLRAVLESEKSVDA